jgi:hypothetical protein
LHRLRQPRRKSRAKPEALDRGDIDLLVMPLPYTVPEHPSALLFEETFVTLRLARASHRE